jgi:hypothetical protein
LKLTWLTEEGKDLASIEKLLGFSLSDTSVDLPDLKVGESESVILAASAGGPELGAVKAILWLESKQGLPAMEMTVSSIDLTDTVEDVESQAVTYERLILEPEVGYSFAPNLLANGSFEKSDGSGAAGWKYLADGDGDFSDVIAYGGRRSLTMHQDGPQGRLWESEIQPLNGSDPLWLSYWVKFDSNARPSGHPNFVFPEVFRQSSDGSLENLPLSFNPELRVNEYVHSYGEWLQIVVGPIEIPEDATHIRAFTQMYNKVKTWRPTWNVANWGTVYVDNVVLFQAPVNEAIPSSIFSRQGRFLANFNHDLLPSFLPSGNQLQNSIALFPGRTKDASMYFADEVEAPEIALFTGNLLPIRRSISVDGTVYDWNNKIVETFSKELSLDPYELKNQVIELSRPEKFGAYYVELKVEDAGVACASSSARLAWLPVRPSIPDSVRLGPSYPFDMHPRSLQVDSESVSDPEEIDYQLSVLRMLGVGAIRLQSRFDGLDLSSPERSIAGAKEKVAIWRSQILPFMQKYAIRGWVSLMEQGSNNLPVIPRTAAELEAWTAYNTAQVEAFGDDVEFFLYGNEGLGSYTTDDLDVDLRKTSKFYGTTREWMELYAVTHAAAQAAKPDVKFGLGHASDPHALVVERFYSVFPDGEHFDCWAFNAYGDTAGASRSILDTIQKHGGGHPFGVIPEVGLDVPSAGPNRASGEAAQARTLVQTYLNTLGRTPWVEHITWFIAQGNGGRESHNIFDTFWGPRPSAAAYLTMTNHLHAGEVVDAQSLPGGGDFYVWERLDGQLVGVGWSDSNQMLSLDVGTDIVYLDDIFGNRQELVTQGGVINIPLSATPQYLVGAKTLKSYQEIVASAKNTTVEKDRAQITLELQNNSNTVQTVQVQVIPQVQLLLSGEDVKTLVLEPGAIEMIPYDVQLLLEETRRRFSVEFSVVTQDGFVIRTRLADTFAQAVRAPNDFKLDGTWAGWENAKQLPANRRNQMEFPMGGDHWGGLDDLSADIMTMWDADNLYIGVRVRDDVYAAPEAANLLFLRDSIEIGLELEHSLSGNAQLWQITAGAVDGQPVSFQHMPAADTHQRQVIVEPGETLASMNYQVAIPWSELDDFEPEPGKQIAFGLIVDDSDGQDHDRKFISWFGTGISSKEPQKLGDLILVE